MAILSKDTTRKQVIDLTGPDGNAYYLMGTACNLMKQLKFTPEEADGVLDEMKSSDYENLIKVFDKYFGKLIDLER
tara:strand:- start:128 stop:355 length:228 start_codon:yes stop_codon:yes gene_type:complete